LFQKKSYGKNATDHADTTEHHGDEMHDATQVNLSE
jgi:hypothetical protein